MKTILFVDDHKLLARMGFEVLERHGYRAVSACNAEAALAIFGQETIDLGKKRTCSPPCWRQSGDC
jgi:CheY-like chemotaxis protein